MSIFTKAFGRERTASLRKREGLNLGALPIYVIYYKQAVDDYNQQNLNGALINIEVI